MSLNRSLAAIAFALVVALAVVVMQARDAGVQRPPAPPAPAAESPAPAPSPRAPAPQRAAAPALPDDAPFRQHDLVVSTDMPEGPLVALRSASRSGRDLAVELAAVAPAPEGKRLFATVSVSDGLGNTVMDCTWRDIELTDDTRKLDCELPVDVALPLTISGHQRPAPSYVETPQVVALDPGVHP